MRDAVAELRLDRSTTWELMLATTEAVANAIEHGAPCGDGRGILLRVETGEASIGVEVCDCGCFPAKPRSAKPDGDGGRGMPIIAAIMDHLEIVPGRGRTRVRFEKRLAAA